MWVRAEQRLQHNTKSHGHTVTNPEQTESTYPRLEELASGLQDPAGPVEEVMEEAPTMLYIALRSVHMFQVY